MAYSPIGQPNVYLSQVTSGANANSTSTVTTSIETLGYANFAISIVSVSGAHANHIFRGQGSPDDVTWYNMASDMTGEDSQHDIVCNHRYFRVKCNTAEGAASTVDIYIQAK